MNVWLKKWLHYNHYQMHKQISKRIADEGEKMEEK